MARLHGAAVGLVALAASTGAQSSSAAAAAALPAPVLRVEQLADSLGHTGGFSGVVLIEKDGAVVFERAYGVADSAAHRLNDIGTRFDVSSVGKLFTQTAVQQLIEAGRMHPDSTIAAYWPDYPNPDVAHRVTIRQMLQHRSGLYGDFFRPDRVGTLRDNHDYLRWFVHDTLHFAPGTRYEYSNAGYVVLGELVARVSGEDYYSYLQRHIFTPAGMTQTRFDARDSLPPSVAVAYTTRTDERSPVRGSAAGGEYSTADDLLRFLVARRNHVIVRRGGGGGMQFGGSVGSSTLVAEGLAGGYGLIILANQDPPIAATIAAPMLPEK